MSDYSPTSFTADATASRQLELLSKDQSRSAVIREAISELYWKKDITVNTTQRTAVSKADNIISKFFSNVSTASDTSWMTIATQAGELLTKRAALIHPHLSTADAVAQVANQPDDVTKALYQLQSINSEAQFASYKHQLGGAA